MCFKQIADSAKVNGLESDMRQIANQSQYLIKAIPDRPEVTKSFSGNSHAKLALKNLNLLMDGYKPPEGMLYRCTGSDISAILKKYGLDDNWTPLDTLYRVPRWDYMQLLIPWDWTNRRTYVAEYGDCDDFGCIFKGHFAEYAMINGIVWVIDWSGGHSYNMLFDIQLQDGSTDANNPKIDVLKSKAIVYEPQSDEWMEAPVTPAPEGGIALPVGWSPKFPRWEAIRKAKAHTIAAKTGESIGDINPKMYPLTECNLIM